MRIVNVRAALRPRSGRTWPGPGARWLAPALALPVAGLLLLVGLRSAAAPRPQAMEHTIPAASRATPDNAGAATARPEPTARPGQPDRPDRPDRPDSARAPLVSPAVQELASLSYEREFFYYDGSGRRDPFKPLLDVDLPTEGPRFDELVLTGLFMGESGGGMVVVEDAKRKGYFLKPGDVVGKATLVEIHPDQAVFDVREFGISRRATLKLQRPEETS